MLIKAYGLNWDPEEIYGNSVQSSAKSFNGSVKKGNKRFEINFWKAKGIYALFQNFEIVYIGKVTENRLGKRIESHWRYRKDQWDKFSFYCFTDIDFNKGILKTAVKKSEINIDIAIKTIEAIIINTAVPFNNKQETKFPNSYKAKQIKYIKRISVYDLMNKLEKIEKRLAPSKRSRKK